MILIFLAVALVGATPSADVASQPDVLATCDEDAAAVALEAVGQPVSPAVAGDSLPSCGRVTVNLCSQCFSCSESVWNTHKQACVLQVEGDEIRSFFTINCDEGQTVFLRTGSGCFSEVPWPRCSDCGGSGFKGWFCR